MKLKAILLLMIVLLVSCAQKREYKKYNHLQLTNYMMEKSLLNVAILSSINASPTCLQPYAQSLSKEQLDKLFAMLAETFNFEDIQKAVRTRLLASTTRPQMLEISRKLDKEIWEKFLKGLASTGEAQKKRYAAISKALDEGGFDINSDRTKLVAQMTEQEFTINMINIIRPQLLKVTSLEQQEKTTPERENTLKLLNVGLSYLDKSFKRELFVHTYIATEGLSEKELQKLVSLKSHEAMKVAREALEEEFAKRYEIFLGKLKAYEIGQREKKV